MSLMAEKVKGLAPVPTYRSFHRRDVTDDVAGLRIVCLVALKGRPGEPAMG